MFCRIDLGSGQRSVSGCPSVTQAAILDYHRTIFGTRFDDGDDYYHNYNGNSYWIDDDWEEYDFPPFPTLNVYLETLEGHWAESVPLTNEDKGALTFAAGVAAHQVYHPGGSGTFGVSQAYDAWLRFGFTGIELLNETNEDLFERMAQNMMDALPVHFAVVTPEWDMGHNLVVDGYNTDDYYHLNFGWGGVYNGWYLLPEEIPYGLTVVEGAICDIGAGLQPVTDAPQLAADYQLACSPNPCNPATEINFRLDSPARVNLAIYNLRGQLVRELAVTQLPAGTDDVGQVVIQNSSIIKTCFTGNGMPSF